MRRTIPSLGAALLLLSAGAQAAIPAYSPKPDTWRTMLVASDGSAVPDSQFAGWIAAEQAAVRALMPNPKDFHLIASFTQCYGGGFLTELDNAGVTLYGANSASRYYQPASYNKGINSYYTFAWTNAANVPAPPPPAMRPNDEAITDTGYNATNGVNRRFAREEAQYWSDRAAGGPPEPLRNQAHNYAILWVGQPRLPEDQNDVSFLYKVLTTQYGYNPMDIFILWSNGAAPAGVAWAVNAAATGPNLNMAISMWLDGKIRGQAKQTAQVFFYAGDHGNVDHPISVAVDANAVGQPGTEVNARRMFPKPVGNVVYTAGAGTNRFAWLETFLQNLRALSFGDDFLNPQAVFNSSDSPYGPTDSIVYFGVTRGSQGLAGSEVNTEATTPGRNPGPDVFVMTAANSNRQMFDGRRSLGLLKGMMPDELNDFVFRDLRQIWGPNQLPTHPIFYTRTNSPNLWVYDPDPVNGGTYPYYTWPAADVANPPQVVDALALVDDGARDPMTHHLYFDKNSDYMLLSIGPNDPNAPWNAFKACDVIKYGPGALAPALWVSCNQLGLQNTDDVDGLDLGAGTDGEPIEFVPDPEPPQWPPYYPPDPYPGPQSPPPPPPPSTPPPTSPPAPGF